ncbi:MFS transporter [Tomitella fengzijianii]|uniref:MFS transporter n=1 Tax=Tomitella fengzijianii TaxID=2597660 RepID=A0A516X5X7_9ACTN|nr:MFS transporter [Tomitella fengzijianii]QDQ98482.1 MFS transporter [Tomitella fengzijianii]
MTGTSRGAAPTGRRSVLAWSSWDAGAAAFNAVVFTFVFSVYLTDQVGEDSPGGISSSAWLGWGLGVAGFVLAVTAPIMGGRADARGRRKRSLAVLTLCTITLMVAMFFVRDSEPYFFLGLVLLASASVMAELANVPYYAMLRQVSTPETQGRVSGIGWSAGYVGGVVLLLLVYAGFITGDGDTRGLLGLPSADGMNIRLVVLFAAVWFVAFAVPLFVVVPEVPATETTPPGRGVRGRLADVAGAYRALFADLRGLWRTDRRTLGFLGASALFRDGLAGVFTFGAVLGVGVYGVSSSDVLMFGVAANVVAAVGAVAGGQCEERVGAKPVIVFSLAAMMVVGVGLLASSGPVAFWACGLVLCLFIGPAQASARSAMARLSPPGGEGQMFGLYATSGRAVSFLAPALFGLFSWLFGADRAGIVGLLIVIGAGLAALLPLRLPGPGERAAGDAGGS